MRVGGPEVLARQPVQGAAEHGQSQIRLHVQRYARGQRVALLEFVRRTVRHLRGGAAYIRERTRLVRRRNVRKPMSRRSSTLHPLARVCPGRRRSSCVSEPTACRAAGSMRTELFAYRQSSICDESYFLSSPLQSS